VEEAVDLAIRQNLDLKSQDVALDTKKRMRDLVWNQWLPQIDLGGTLSYANKATPVTPTSIPIPSGTGESREYLGSPGTWYDGVSGVFVPNMPSKLPQWSVAASLGITLNFSFALFEGMRAIRLDYEAGLVTREKARIQLERDVRKAYYNMLLLENQIALLEDSLANANRQVATAEANYRGGLAPRLNLLQAQVARDNLKPSIDQAENGLKLAQANFAMLLGLPYDTQFSLIPLEDRDLFIPLEVQDLIAQASQKKPDILELRAKLLTLESSRKAQAIQLYTPTLRFGWTYAPTFATGADPWKTSWFKESSWSDKGAFSIALGFTFNNYFPFTKEGQGLKDQDNTIRTAQIGLSQMIQGTEVEVYNTVLSLEQTRATVEAQKNTVNLAEESYRLTEAAYKAGLKDSMEVQNAELELRKARIGVLEQNFTYLQGLIDLEYAIGAKFGTLSGGK
jgi:outer membrane protein TolC